MLSQNSSTWQNLIIFLWLLTKAHVASCDGLLGDDKLGKAPYSEISLSVASYLARNYATDCALKFIHNGSVEAAGLMLRDTLQHLQNFGSLHTVAAFEVNQNQRFTDPSLDLFLSWGRQCVVNVLYLTSLSSVMDQATLDFTMKLCSRDRTGVYFVVYGGGTLQRQWLFQRLRNFKSTCLLALDHVGGEVDCLEQSMDDEARNVHEV